MAGTTNRNGEPDLAAIGYPAVRRAFNEVLNTCAKKLTQAEITWACEILGTAVDGDAEALERIMDTGLYSFARNQPNGRAAKRPIDRIAKSLSFKADPLKAAMLRAMPTAFFSLFEVKGEHDDGGVVLTDMLDNGRRLHLMDAGLADSAAEGTLLALRVTDLGPWHIGFGIVIPLCRSEAAAIMLAHATDEPGERSAVLHELVYGARLHDEDLVSLAIEPIVAALSLAVDSSDAPLAEMVEYMRSALVPDDPEALDRLH